MKLSMNWRTLRWVALGLAAVIALLAWASASAQPEPPYQVYGYNEPGDEIAIYDADGNEKGTATADSEGAWFTQIQCSEETLHLLTFTLNGAPATAEVKRISSTLAEITLNPAPPPAGEDSAMPAKGDDEMMEENGEMMEENGEMMEEDESMEEDKMQAEYPDSGSGGLAGQGASTTALIGTLLVVSALIAGAGFWALRRRA